MERRVTVGHVFLGEGLWSEIELAAQTPVQKMLATLSSQSIFKSSTSPGHWQTLKDKFAVIIQYFQNGTVFKVRIFSQEQKRMNYQIRAP